MSGHTPGPWTIKHDFNVFAIDSPERLVAAAGGYSTNRHVESVRDENIANARLIAAAPELLEMLRQVLLVARGAEMLLTGEIHGPHHLGDMDHAILNAADAAIAKAEGK